MLLDSMAKTKIKTSIFLCCFGGPPPNNKASVESLTATNKGTTDPIILQKHNKRRTSNNCFSWLRVLRIRKNSASKTVPLEAHYSKVKSKSTLNHKSQAPATNSLPLTQALPVHPVTPYYTPSQTRHGPSNRAETTSQQGRGSLVTVHEKQQCQTTSSSRKHKNARGCPNDAVAGMSVIMVTLVIMILWGRICAILCTSAWLYCIPRFKNNNEAENADDSGELVKKTKNEVVDLDSVEYKKKVIMEGLLERNKHFRG